MQSTRTVNIFLIYSVKKESSYKHTVAVVNTGHLQDMTVTVIHSDGSGHSEQTENI